MNLVITFDPTGCGRCLYSELIDLAAIGALTVKRASRIEFDNPKQRWVVRTVRGRTLFFSRSHSACLAWEQQNLQ
jgi:hypothetical protein